MAKMKIQLIVLACIAMLVSSNLFAAPELRVGNASTNSGQEVSIPIDFVADGTVVALQFDLKFNATALSLQSANPGTALGGHAFNWQEIKPGTLRLVITTATQEKLINGSLASLRMLMAAESSSGNYPLEISNVVMSNASAHRVNATNIQNGNIISKPVGPPTGPPTGVTPIPTLSPLALLLLIVLIAGISRVFYQRGHNGTTLSVFISGIIFSALIGLTLFSSISVHAASLPGDANNDSAVNAADIPVIVEQILERATAPGDPDCNADQSVDVLDTVCVLTQEPPLEGTYISGRALDTNAYTQDGTELPIVGVKIRFLGEDTVAVTDNNGEFIIGHLNSGEKVIDFDAKQATPAPTGDGYASFREHIIIAEGANAITRPFYLPRIASNSLTTIDPNVDVVVNNSELGVSLTVFAGSAKDENGNLFTGQLSISEVPDGLAPASMPEDLEPGLLFTIQPVGVTFDIPAPLTIRNERDNWAPGSQIDLWSLDPDAGIFTIVGIGQVSADGQMIETISGGVRAADWHLPSPPPAEPGPPPPDDDGPCSNCCGNAGSAGSPGGAGDGNGGSSSGGGSGCGAGGTGDPKGWGSEVDFHNGRFREYISLPAYVSMNRARRLELAYASDRAYPLQVMPTTATILASGPRPDKISYQAYLDGTQQGYEIFLNAAELSEDLDETFRMALPLDGTSLDTNTYLAQARVTSHYEQSKISSRIVRDVSIVNDIQSEYGAGWRLMGLDRLYQNDTSTVLLVDGQGMPRQYKEANATGSIITIITDFPENEPALVVIEMLEQMGVAYQIRVSGQISNDFSVIDHPIISTDDIEPTALFIVFPGGQPLMANKGFTTNEKSNLMSVLETAKSQGVSLMFLGNLILPWDTGFGTNPDCCFHEPELTRYENLTRLKRLSDTDRKPVVIRRWRLVEPNHPVFIGAFGSVIPVSDDPFTNNLDVAYGTQAVTGLDGSETVLAEAWTPSGPGNTLLGETPIATYEDPLSTARVLVVSIRVTLPEPDIAVIIKNSIDWLTSNIREPGQLVSSKGDATVLTRLADGSFTRRLKNGYLYTFDSNGYLKTTKDRNNNIMSYSYNGDNQLISIADPVAKITKFSYVNGKLATITGPANRTTRFEHNDSGDLTKVIYPDNSTRLFSYDEHHLMISQTDQRGFITSYEFNQAGQAIKSTQADGSIRTLVPAQSIGYVEPQVNSKANPAKMIKVN